MKFRNKITGEIRNCAPNFLDASRVSAQSRKRLFWVGEWKGNHYERIEIPQPEDRKIFLKDILEPVVDKKYFINYKIKMNKWKSVALRVNPIDNKSACL